MLPYRLLAALRQAPAFDRASEFPVFLQGEMPLGLWMLEAGQASLSLTSECGRNVILEALEAGDIAGLAAAVTGSCHESNLKTGSRCRLRLLLRSDLLLLLADDSSTSLAVAAMLALELATTQRWIGHTMLGSRTARLASFLLRSTTAELARITQQEVANSIGTSREGVSRLVRDLRNAGALSTQRGGVHVCNRVLLEKLAS